MKVCIECRRCFDDPEVYCTEEGHPALSQVRDGGRDIVPGYRPELFLGSDIRGETFFRRNAAGAPCLITIRSADEDHSRRFLCDAELAAVFCHPNVVDVYEAGRLETGEVYVVCEDAEGRTLRQLLETESVPRLLTSVQVVRQTAEALYALHASGLTHGAVNPQNIILTTDAQNRLLVRIKDLDLGGVISRSVISNKIHNDSALESLRYFAPEQCSGSEASGWADIYSLGVVLHEMLAGAPPFNASKAVGLIEQHRNQPPPEVRIDDIDLRMLLTHTLTEALRKQPEMRQASANVFARQMRHMEQLATHSSVPPPALAMPLVPPQRETVINAAARPPVRDADTQPPAVMEVPRTAHEEGIQRAAAIVELYAASVIGDEIEPVSSVQEHSVADPPEFLDRAAAEPIVQDAIVYEQRPVTDRPRRSRLGVLKRRLRSMALRANEIAKSSVHDLSEVLNTAVEEPIVQNVSAQEEQVVPERPRRSRLKALKRKLRAMARHTPEDPESSVDDLPEILYASAEEPIVQNAVVQGQSDEPKGPRRSRLRVLKRKLRLMAPNTPEISAVKSPRFEETLVQTKASPAEIRTVEAVGTATAAVAMARATPKLVQWEQPDDAIPSEADALETPSKGPNTEIPFVDVEPRQVTYVPAYSRFRVDLEPPEVPVRFLPDDDLMVSVPQKVVFLPSLGIASAIRESVDTEQNDPLFSSFYGQSRGHRRWGMVGGGIVMLAALVFFGRISMRDLVPADTPVDTQSKPPALTTTQTSLPQAKQPISVSPAGPTTVKKIENYPPPGPEITRSKPSQQKNTQLPSTERPRSSTAGDSRRMRTPNAALVSRNLGPMPSAVSTVVITYGNGKVTSKTETGRKPPAKKPVAAPRKTADPARPRIVRDPN